MSINSMKALNRASSETSRSDLFSVSPEMLAEESGFNVRGAFDDDYFEQPEVKEHIRGIADSYKAGRYVPPIVVQVRNGVPYIRDGMHRKHALMLAISEGAEIKRVQVLEHRGDEAQQTILLATSNDGRPLSPMERAVIYDRLVKWGWTAQEISASVRRTVNHVNQTLTLLDMPLELKRKVQRNEISATQAAEIFREHGEDAIGVVSAAQEKSRKTKVTKKDVGSRKSVPAKVMRASLVSIADMIDYDSLSDEDEVTLTLSSEQVAQLREIKETLECKEAKC